MINERLFVTKPHLPPRGQFDQYLDEIWASNQLTNFGPLHNRLKDELIQTFDGSCVTLTANGHLGLEMALHVLGIEGEVITTPYSFASTTHAMTWLGLTPVFCDIRESDFTIDPEKIEPLITERTSAIMPVHVYGHVCDIGKIGKIAKKHNLKVIYDAAHAFGVRYDGKSIASYGDVSVFSFHATKLFHTIEGGALVYGNPELQRAFEAVENFGIFEGMYDYIGINAKMNEFEAAMGLCILPELDRLFEERRQITLRYMERLSRISGISCISVTDNPGVYHNYSYMPVLVGKEAFGCSRDELHSALRNQQIFCRRYFYPLIPDYSCYKGQFPAEQTPVASKAAQQVLCLPIFNGMAAGDIDRVCEAILNIGGYLCEQ